MLLMDAADKNAASHVHFLSLLFEEKQGELRSDALELVRQFLRAVLLAIFWMHAAGVANKDIKPENLLISKQTVNSKSVFTGADGSGQTLAIGDFGHAALPDIVSTAKIESLRHPPTDVDTVSPQAKNQIRGSNRAAKIYEAVPLVPKNPPEQNANFCMVKIEELKQYHRGLKHRQNVATKLFCPPERQSQISGNFHTSKEFFPGDLYAVGIIAARILSGGHLIRTPENDDKLLMNAATDSVFWTHYLHKDPKSSIPDSWKPVINLARGLLDADPSTRLTCKQALEHQFFSAEF
jgi:serine/threonine protein kinase